MVRGRTTAELIRELTEEARDASGAALVVTLPEAVVLIWANDTNRISQLDQALAGGGEPVGLLRTSAGQTKTRAFCEYSDSETALGILESLRARRPTPPPGEIGPEVLE